jgi:hypothetical protein
MSSRARIMLKERDDRASPAICPDGSCRVFLATPVKIERVVSSDAPSPVPRPPSSVLRRRCDDAISEIHARQN